MSSRTRICVYFLFVSSGTNWAAVMKRGCSTYISVVMSQWQETQRRFPHKVAGLSLGKGATPWNGKQLDEVVQTPSRLWFGFMTTKPRSGQSAARKSSSMVVISEDVWGVFDFFCFLCRSTSHFLSLVMPQVSSCYKRVLPSRCRHVLLWGGGLIGGVSLFYCDLRLN